MSDTMEIRTVFATVKPESVYGDQPRVVRFAGQTFEELRQRLEDARLPGYTAESFVEVQLGDGTSVCLLADEILPEGALHVTVHNFSQDAEWQKPLPWARGLDLEEDEWHAGPYFYSPGPPPPLKRGGHEHPRHHGPPGGGWHLKGEGPHGRHGHGHGHGHGPPGAPHGDDPDSAMENHRHHHKHKHHHHHKGGRSRSHSRSRSRSRSPHCRGKSGRHQGCRGMGGKGFARHFGPRHWGFRFFPGRGPAMRGMRIGIFAHPPPPHAFTDDGRAFEGPRGAALVPHNGHDEGGASGMQDQAAAEMAALGIAGSEATSSK